MGLGIGMLAVRVLALFFTLPPPLVTMPAGSVGLFALAVAGGSAIAMSWSLAAVTRIAPAEVLREP